MRRIALTFAMAAMAVFGVTAAASAATITNGTVTLGVNAAGDLNDVAAGIGLTYNATKNDGTIYGCWCEGWGAGAGDPGARFQGRANEDWGGIENATPVSFTTTATDAFSVVDILNGETPGLRLTQDFHPAPTSPFLYEITTTVENISGGPLNDVRYERIMDWDIEPTPTNEFVTINRGSPPPGDLIYSDDNGFSDNFPFTFLADGDGPQDPATVNANYVDKGPDDHGARFTFSFGALAPGEKRTFFVYYGAAGTEPDANTAVSSAALEMFSYGQPNVPDGDDADALPDGPVQGEPNTFIWGFRAVGGKPVIPPTLSVAPASATKAVGETHGVTATVKADDGTPIQGSTVVFEVAGANSTTGSRTTDDGGNASFSYAGSNAGDDTITACLDSNDSGACEAGEVTDTASAKWESPPPPPPPPPPPANQQVQGTTAQSPAPVLGQSVVAGVAGGTVLVKGKDGKFRTLGANESIPLGSTIDATKGRVRLTSASGPGGATQIAVFYQGAFVVTQTHGPKPITQLALSGKLTCPKGKRATASARKRVRRLWGDGKGRFRTRGRHGAATVKGTKWLTEDRCDSTLVRVRRGTVIVRDFAKRRNVTVKKGHSYVARAKSKKK
jgi:type IV pilus assembly protein PilY1